MDFVGEVRAKMGMTIEQIIKYLPAPICGATVIGEEMQKYYEAHDTAVNILRKYQKIQEIVQSKTTRVSYDIGFRQIKKVVEDGNS